MPRLKGKVRIDEVYGRGAQVLCSGVDAVTDTLFGAMLFDAEWKEGDPLPTFAITLINKRASVPGMGPPNGTTRSAIMCNVTDHSSIKKVCKKISFQMKDLVRSNKHIINVLIYSIR